MPSNKPSSVFSLHPKPKPSTSTNNNNNSNQACAPDCLLAPYFPHDRHHQFLNAHKLFGVSNITKIIKNLTPLEKDAAMHTIMFQSDARANDPVEGCYSIIRKLQYQIEYTRTELEMTLQQLSVFRHHQEPHIQHEDISSNNAIPYDYSLHEVQEHNQEQQQYCASGNFNIQEDMWCLQLQDSSSNVKAGFIDECEDVKPLEDVSSEHHVDFVEQRKLDLPSTQFIISS